MKPSKTLLPFLTATAIAVATSSAAITVTAFSSAAGPRINSANINDTIATDWDLGTSNTIAVYLGTENSTGGTFTATFAGQAMTVIQVVGGANNHISGIAYLINPTVTIGDVVIQATHNGSGRHSYAWGVVSLRGVDSVAGTDARTTNGNLSYTIGLNGGFALGAATNNNFNGPAPTITGNPSTDLFNSAFDGNASARFAYGTAPVGSSSDAYSGLNSAVTVAFNAVPEPTTALLGGLGMLFLLRRRRG